MKLLLDIEQSLKKCPPTKSPFLKKIPERILKDIEHVARKRIKPNDVIYRIDDQTRELKVVQSNVAPLKTSFEVSGFIHDEYPPVVIEDSDKEGRYLGIIGHTRDQAFKELNVEFMMYDVYKFKSPLAKRYFNNCSNRVEAPKVPHTKNDITFQVLQAIENKELSNLEDDIMEFIDVVASDKSKSERKAIYKNVRERKSQYTNLATYHCGQGLNSTTEAAKKYNLPYKGKEGLATSGKLGYIPPYANPITNFAASKKLIKEHGYQDIYFTFYIPEPQPQPALTKERQNIEKAFDDAVRVEAEWIQIVMEQLGQKINIDDIQKVLPWKKDNWLPQDLTPQSSDGGKPKENGIVDVYGNAVTR
jgi:hypothetical protein